MYEGGDEMSCSVVERDVVWMRGDAGFVEGDEHVDRGGGGVYGFIFHGVGEIGCECGGKEIGDLLLLPGGCHAIWEIAAKYQYFSYSVVKRGNLRRFHNENIVFLSQSERDSTLC
jgi:hypothetical protein